MSKTAKAYICPNHGNNTVLYSFFYCNINILKQRWNNVVNQTTANVTALNATYFVDKKIQTDFQHFLWVDHFPALFAVTLMMLYKMKHPRRDDTCLLQLEQNRCLSLCGRFSLTGWVIHFFSFTLSLSLSLSLSDI